MGRKTEELEDQFPFKRMLQGCKIEYIPVSKLIVKKTYSKKNIYMEGFKKIKWSEYRAQTIGQSGSSRQ